MKHLLVFKIETEIDGKNTNYDEKKLGKFSDTVNYALVGLLKDCGKEQIGLTRCSFSYREEIEQ